MAQADKIDAEKLRELFDIALKAGDAKPSRTACEELAKAIHLVLESQNKIGNRRNNADLERRQRGVMRISELKDLSPREEQEKRFRNFQEASSRLLTAIKEVRIAARDIEDNDGSCLWIDKGGVVSTDDLEELLLRACAVPVAARPAPYRPRQIWHGAARSIADLIGTTLRNAGYKKNLNSIDQNSAVAFVGAEVINVAYGAKIRPSGFATAMRNRNRIKKTGSRFRASLPRRRTHQNPIISKALGLGQSRNDFGQFSGPHHRINALLDFTAAGNLQPVRRSSEAVSIPQFEARRRHRTLD